jgi:glycerophosphoryl diester phosphodiesterase
MIIISHRGYWLDPEEKNTETAFRRSFGLKFGTETDLRDQDGQLVIAHDIPISRALGYQEFLAMLGNEEHLLAVNIKSDGLAGLIRHAMAGRSRQSWFVFDMSVPDMRAHLREGNPVFARMSEVEKELPWFDQIEGVWLDGFEGIWFDTGLIQRLLTLGKRVCVVSSELHNRPQDSLWEMLKPVSSAEGLILCTDLPELARTYFGVKK